MPRILFLLLLIASCTSKKKSISEQITKNPYLMILGVAQDAGYPQADCKKDCCEMVWSGLQKKRMVSCLALVDPKSGQSWMFDATPDFREQLNNLQEVSKLSGIFLTHAHIGHYTGLMHLGREAMGAKKMPVYAMPRLGQFLANNGPWSQLVSLENIALQKLKADSLIELGSDIQVVPLVVPHRDEFSETVGFKIKTKNKIALFIPDIDKWGKWNRDIKEVIKEVDYAFLDGTFFENGELPGRDMNQIPHPFVEESMDLFSTLSTNEKTKIHFIHFNHTNPLLREGSSAQQKVEDAGFHFAKEGQIIEME